MTRRHALVPVLLAALVTIVLAPAVAAQTTRPQRPPRPPRPPSANTTLNIAIKQLTEEARQAVKDGALPRHRADFAGSFAHRIPADAVAKKMTRPISRTPFVDAYVRWQLTSFEPKLPRLDDRKYDRFMSQLPKMYPNPRGHPDLLALVDAMRDAAPLDETQQRTVAARLDELESITQRARDLNRPALELRAWLAKQVEVERDRARAIAVALERVAASIEAGWSVDGLKGPLEQQFTDARWDDAFTDEQRARVARLARALSGRKHAVLSRARLREDTLEVAFDETAVYDFDVTRWLKAMERK